VSKADAVFVLLLRLLLSFPSPCFDAAAAAAVSLPHLAHLVLQAQPLVKRLAADDHLHRDAGLAHVLSTNDVSVLRMTHNSACSSSVGCNSQSYMALSD
jgi:hypothetical protein